MRPDWEIFPRAPSPPGMNTLTGRCSHEATDAAGPCLAPRASARGHRDATYLSSADAARAGLCRALRPQSGAVAGIYEPQLHLAHAALGDAPAVSARAGALR